MKFGTLLASAAALALMTAEAEARGGLGQYTKVPKYGHRHSTKSNYAKKRVAEEKERMELVYGKGLVGLYDEKTGKIDHKRFGWDNRRPGREQAIWVQINGKQYNAGSVEAFTLGYVQGVQYMPDAGTLDAYTEAVVMSNCFYALKGVIGSIETLVYDWQNMGKYSGEYNWFNLIFDPLHILGDATVAYEMCNIYEDLDKIVGLLSMDWGLLSEQVTEIGMYMWLESNELLQEIQGAWGEDCLQEAVALANQAINDGLDEIEDLVNKGETEIDVDGLKQQLEDSGYVLDCVLKDVDLHTVGNDLGIMISRMLQAQIDATN